MQVMTTQSEKRVTHDFHPIFEMYDDGSVTRFMGTDTVSASMDPVTGVESQDVDISPEVMVRLYKPRPPAKGDVTAKLPLLVYFHGGAFVIESAKSPTYHNYLNDVSSKANVLVVSVDYRRAPECPLPTCYDDSWAALEWSLSGGHSWIKDHADMSKVFLGGDSSGANIAHYVAKKMGSSDNNNKKMVIKGALLVDPFFWGEERIGSEIEKLISITGSAFNEFILVYFKGPEFWALVAPEAINGWDDPMINPAKDPELGVLAAEKVMVCVAELDVLRDRGCYYRDALLKSGFKGTVDLFESPGEGHVFHLFDPTSPQAVALMDNTVAFLNSS